MNNMHLPTNLMMTMMTKLPKYKTSHTTFLAQFASSYKFGDAATPPDLILVSE